MAKNAYDMVMSGKNDNNIRFTERIKDDHHIYKRNDIIERIVIQPLGNKAKAYQVKQVRNLFIKYGL